MSEIDIINHFSPLELHRIFSRLSPQHVEQFYAAYQRWSLEQQITHVQTKIEILHHQIAENVQRMQQAHPSAIALASLARLQSSGVNDLDLLDRMLERGDEWLDHTMEQLEHCEELGVIQNNYTAWCEHALEGAYEWLDSMYNADPTSPLPPSADLPNEQANIAIEEQFLSKLMSEDEADASAITLKRLKIPFTPPLPEESLLVEPSPFEQSPASPTTFAATNEASPTPPVASDQPSAEQQTIQQVPAQPGEEETSTAEVELDQPVPVEHTPPAEYEQKQPSAPPPSTEQSHEYLPRKTPARQRSIVRQALYLVLRSIFARK